MFLKREKSKLVPQHAQSLDSAPTEAHREQSGMEPEPSPLFVNTALPAEHNSDLDPSIAVRKGKRNCTQHPISHYVSYHNLSDNYKAFMSSLNTIETPQTAQEALRPCLRV